MADTTTSTNMSMPIPVVGQDPGPQWGEDVNSCLLILDAHDHTTGYGVAITPSAMNINSTLTFANNALTNAKYLGMYLQVSDPGVNGSLYYKGSDLYFQDGAANVVRITQSGSVAGASGTITGLPSGTASAAFSSATFVFQSATNVAALIDGRSIILRNSTASSFGCTLNPPSAMGADISMTLPTIPASTQAMNMTSAGLMGTITYDNIGVAMTSTGANAIAASRTRSTGTTVGAGGVAISSSSSTFSLTGTTITDVTNLQVTITTSGRPVMLMLIADGGTASPSRISVNNTGGSPIGYFYYDRGGSSINYMQWTIQATGDSNSFDVIPPAAFSYVDAVAAGTYTYKLKVQGGAAGDTVAVTRVKLVAYEL